MTKSKNGHYHTENVYRNLRLSRVRLGLVPERYDIKLVREKAAVPSVVLAFSDVSLLYQI